MRFEEFKDMLKSGDLEQIRPHLAEEYEARLEKERTERRRSRYSRKKEKQQEREEPEEEEELER